MTGWTWNKQKEDAASLLADGQLSDEKIAAKIKVSERQLNRWKKEPKFQARIKALVDAWKARIRDRLLCIKEGRIESLLNDFERTEIIVRERAEKLGEVSGTGGASGFIALDWKGKNADKPVFVFDAALFRERRAVREQIADELGQLTKRIEHTGTGPDGEIRVIVEYAKEAAKS